MIPSIFDYTCLRNYLSDYFEYKQGLDQSFSMKKWADQLKLPNSASLHRVISGERTPGDRVVESLLREFDFTPLEKSQFFHLVLKSKAETDDVLKRIVSDRFKLGLPKDNNSPKTHPSSMIEINNGKILSLIGNADLLKVNASLSEENLEAVPVNNSAMVGLNYCEYKDSTLGPYDEYYSSILVKPKDEPISQSGLLFREVTCSKASVVNLGKFVWGNNYKFGEISLTEPNKNISAVSKDENGKTVSKLFFSKPRTGGRPIPGGANFYGYANVFGSRRRFRLEAESNTLEYDFNKETDSYFESDSYWDEINFNPISWHIKKDVRCSIY